MRKLWMYLIIAAAVLLTACQASGGGGEKGQTTTQPTDPATTKPSAVATQDPNVTAMECQVVSMNPTPGPTEVSIFPPVTDEDWVLGEAQDPVLTITEYSDFQ